MDSNLLICQLFVYNVNMGHVPPQQWSVDDFFHLWVGRRTTHLPNNPPRFLELPSPLNLKNPTITIYGYQNVGFRLEPARIFWEVGYFIGPPLSQPRDWSLVQRKVDNLFFGRISWKKYINKKVVKSKNVMK